MAERFCGIDDAHGGHQFVADDEPDSPNRYCPGRTPAEVQYGRPAPGDVHERVPSHTRVPSRVQARDEPCKDPATCDVHGPKPHGDMHEPPPYRGELDWWPIGNDSDNE